MSSALLRTSNHDAVAEINITPLVDVLLVLLVIFMITAPIVTQRIQLPLAGGPPQGLPPEVLELSVAADGQVTKGNGILLSELELQAEMLTYAGKTGPVSLTLRPSADTPHQRVIDLLAMARDSHLTNIAIERPN